MEVRPMHSGNYSVLDVFQDFIGVFLYASNTVPMSGWTIKHMYSNRLQEDYQLSQVNYTFFLGVF